MPRKTCHEHLLQIVKRLPGDYTGHGGEVERDADPEQSYPDCSCGCVWAAWLEDEPLDWCVCTNPNSHRCGLLTFEHQAGHGCFAHKFPRGEGFKPGTKGRL